METILSVENIVKSYKRKLVVDNISFSVSAGEVYGFVGPNAAGKTTTIRLILGLNRPDSGSIKICGWNVIKDYQKAAENVGGTVDGDKFIGNISGMENLKLLALIRCKNGKLPEDIDDLIEKFGLKKRINDKVKEYSLGMCRRLSILQSVMHKPKLLVLDEPTNGLDPASVKQMREFLVDYAHNNNAAVLISSHMLSEIEMMCERVSIMDKGKITEVLLSDREKKHSEGNIFRMTVYPLDEAERILKDFNIVGIGQDYIDIAEKQEMLNKIMVQLINNNIIITDIKIIKKTLEDAFIEITGGESGID